MTAAALRVMLADDHTLFREGVREMLSTSPEIEVVGEVADGDAAIARAAALRPDVVLLDVEMPGPGAVAVLVALLGHDPSLHVVMLTMHDDPALLRDLLANGAAGYLVKTIGRRDLVSAVLAQRDQSNVVISVPRRSVREEREEPGTTLSPRELEVARLLPQALSNGQIARRLNISEGTVKRHLTNVYRKLDAVSRIDAITKATALGLIGGIGAGSG